MIPTSTSIETMSGRFVDLICPDPATIVIEDIAWALSRMPRYLGHTVSAIPYTIGQHSLYVAKLINDVFSPTCPSGVKASLLAFLEKLEIVGVRKHCFSLLEKNEPPRVLLLEALLHDAPEAYLLDVPTPLKHAKEFHEVYKNLEQKMETAVRTSLGMGVICLVHDAFVKWADQFALTVEAYNLVKSRGANWSRLLPLDMTELTNFGHPVESIVTYRHFIATFRSLISTV